MSTLLHDIRYGLRMLLKTPVVSIISALSLALGITGATAMFALASSFFFEPLPFGQQDELVMLRQIRPGDGIENAAGLSVPNFRDLEQASTTFTGATAFSEENVNVTGLEQPEQIQVVTGTPNMIDVLRIPLSMGRGFRADEGTTGANQVLILTHGYWQRRFLGDPGAVGKTLLIEGVSHTIIGVTREGFEMIPATVEAFRPSDLTHLTDRADPDRLVLARLRAGTTLEQANSELQRTFSRLQTDHAEANRNWNLIVMHAGDWFPGPTDTKLIKLLLVVSLFGLAIACANIANLLLGRAEIRIKEIAVRTALGAARSRLLRQMLTESVMLALIGAGLGIFFSVYAIAGLRTAMPPQLPQSFWPALDLPTLVATVVVAMMAGVLFGLAPALYATGGSLREVLGESTRGGTAGKTRKRIRNFFVTAEIAVALALLTGAGFLMKAMDLLVNADTPFDANRLLTFELTLPEHRYASPPDLARFTVEAERMLREIPGVNSVAAMASLPRSRGNPSARFQIEGRTPVDPGERPQSGWQAVNPAYFATLRIPLVSGRALLDSDRADAPPVALVNQEFVRRHFPGEEPLGRRIEIQGTTREIVGVVANIIQSRIPEGADEEPAVYLPIMQEPLRNPAFALEITGDASTISAEVRRAVSRVDPDQPVALVRTLQTHIEESLAGPRVLGLFVLALGLLAMVLAAVGIYGVMAHSVVQANREIGIRMAIGARQSQVVAMITRRGIVLTAIGLAAGVPISLLIQRGVHSALNLWEVDVPPDYALIAAGMLAFVALLASWVHALGAAKVAPVQALQNE
jgi:putative ABC transport system permease protein